MYLSRGHREKRVEAAVLHVTEWQSLSLHSHLCGQTRARALLWQGRQSRARHRKQSYPCASITNPTHSSLCMHTQDGFAAHLRAFESGACCEDSQPAEFSETFRFYPRTAFVSLPRLAAQPQSLSFLLRAAEGKHIAMLLSEGAQ